MSVQFPGDGLAARRCFTYAVKCHGRRLRWGVGRDFQRRPALACGVRYEPRHELAASRWLNRLGTPILHEVRTRIGARQRDTTNAQGCRAGVPQRKRLARLAVPVVTEPKLSVSADTEATGAG